MSHLDVLQNHVAVSVKGLDARKELSVVSDGDEDLGVAADRRLEDGKGSGAEFVLFELCDFVLGQLVARLGEKLPVGLRVSTMDKYPYRGIRTGTNWILGSVDMMGGRLVEIGVEDVDVVCIATTSLNAGPRNTQQG